MSSQIIVLGVTFIVFGIIATIAQQPTIAYFGLMLIGVAGVTLGLLSRSK